MGFGDVVIVDSGSTDRTKEIASRSRASIYDNAFRSFAQQRNWAIENCEPKRDWILFLDADEVATPEFKNAEPE